MNKNKITTVMLVSLFAWLTISNCNAQLPAITPQDGYAILQTYLSLPDTSLSTQASTSSSPEHHTIYEFKGNHGGVYHIDASTLEKSIGFGGTDDANALANPATALQMQQTALAFVSQHFPNYSDNLLRMFADDVSPDDCDVYLVSFWNVPASGARVPIECMVSIKESTGQLLNYSETDFALSVGTDPSVTRDQAISIGQNWIAQNITTDALAGQLALQTDDTDVAN